MHKALRTLLYYEIIALVDIFQFHNTYTTTHNYTGTYKHTKHTKRAVYKPDWEGWHDQKGQADEEIWVVRAVLALPFQDGLFELFLYVSQSWCGIVRCSASVRPSSASHRYTLHLPYIHDWTFCLPLAPPRTTCMLQCPSHLCSSYVCVCLLYVVVCAFVCLCLCALCVCLCLGGCFMFMCWSLSMCFVCLSSRRCWVCRSCSACTATASPRSP